MCDRMVTPSTSLALVLITSKVVVRLPVSLSDRARAVLSFSSAVPA